MNVPKIILAQNYSINRQYTTSSHNNNAQIKNYKTYNPIAYKDFNINFGERLFRTPENFYEQPFNKANMPKTMLLYLNENYETRCHIPPAQMMKIVFKDIEKAKTLEEVKDMFDEPLFDNLHSMSNRNYREGILAEIKYLKEPDKSLFKNGKDDLGIYVLKKIYLEGKTLKEINKDFKKDVSVYYSGLSNITYKDLANFGIKFPNNAFWHSFVVTREDFPYIPVNRKDAEYHAKKQDKERSLSDLNSQKEDKRPPKYKVKDDEVKRLTQAIMDGQGDKTKTEKALKNKFRQNDPKLQFIQQYMGEIMAITLERIHASSEMRDYFENNEKLDTSSKVRMQKYWDNIPQMKALQGLVMSDTIKLFFESYGADGNNDVFKDLIDYAHSIKPNREREILKHNALQDEYENELGIFEDQAVTEDKTDPEDISNKTSENDKEISEQKTEKDEPLDKKEYKYVYDIDGCKVRLKTSIEDLTDEYFHYGMDDYLPSPYINMFIPFVLNHKNSDLKLLLGYILGDSKNNATEELKSMLYSEEENIKKMEEINFDYMKKYIPETRAAHQAIVTTMCNKLDNIEDKKNLLILYNMYPLQIPQIKQDLNIDMAGSTSELNKCYSEYRKPITNSESLKIVNKISDLLRIYNINNSHLMNTKDIYKNEINSLIDVSNCFKNPKNKTQKLFKEQLITFILKDYGGSARAIIDPSLPDEIKTALMEDIILSYRNKKSTAYNQLIMLSKMDLNKI